MRKNSKILKLMELLPEDSEIIYDEYIRFKQEVLTNKDMYYVYSLNSPDGHPFYFGKGKVDRAWDHLLEYANNPNKKFKSKKMKYINYFVKKLHEYPIVHLHQTGMTEDEAFSLESILVEHYGRIGFDEHGVLTNVMPGGNVGNHKADYCAMGGKLGGRATKDRGHGIFSESWDRGAQTRLNWESGIMGNVDFVSMGKTGGAISTAQQLGIHDPKYADKRSEWAKIGSDALAASGNRKGCATKEWMAENPDKQKENASKGGKIGGKKHAGMRMWNNGVINKKSHECPGEGWVLGMLMSEKKRAQVYAMLAGHNRKNNTVETKE